MRMIQGRMVRESQTHNLYAVSELKRKSEMEPDVRRK